MFCDTVAGEGTAKVAVSRGEDGFPNEGKREGEVRGEAEAEAGGTATGDEVSAGEVRVMGLALTVAIGVDTLGAPPSFMRFVAASRNTCRATASLSNASCAAQLASMARIGISSGSEQENSRRCSSVDSDCAARAISGEKKDAAGLPDADKGLRARALAAGEGSVLAASRAAAAARGAS